MIESCEIAVVGGGAAGMMAALYAARAGAQRVLLLERNEKLGKKIYITGKGRCNVTNRAVGEDFMRNVVRNRRFAYAALSLLDSAGLMELMEKLGVPLKVERGDRVFPQSDHASDITRVLEKELRRLGVITRLNARVRDVEVQQGTVCGVRFEDGSSLAARRVILATGGLSYPSTGSTGDGLEIARHLGHEITPTMPALAPIITREEWPRSVMGISLRNVRLSAFNGKKRFYDEQGELLLTHFGISGPLALTLSSLLPEQPAGVRLQIDLKPALDDQTLDARLLRDFKEMARKRLGGVMDGLVPHNLGVVLLELAGLSEGLTVSNVTQAQRRALLDMLKRLPLTVAGLRGFEEAIVTRGGVQVKQINPSTMQSKCVEGLYFAGEVTDLDALTGGFNLQLAFSTGALAGRSAALSLEQGGETE